MFCFRTMGILSKTFQKCPRTKKLDKKPSLIQHWVLSQQNGSVWAGKQNVHNFLPDLHNNPDKLLNQKSLYYFTILCSIYFFTFTVLIFLNELTYSADQLLCDSYSKKPPQGLPGGVLEKQTKRLKFLAVVGSPDFEGTYSSKYETQ